MRGLRRRLARGRPSPAPDPDASLTAAEREILERVRPYTLTSSERVLAVLDAVSHVVARDIPGALVECGVWRGGSVLAMVLELQRLGVDDRDVVLFDTFEGMTRPSEADTSSFDEPALTTWNRAMARGRQAWDGWFDQQVSRADVERLLVDTGYPRERIHLVAGPVEETLPEHAPDRISVLRLDTDWYTSTRHELEHLYPRVSSQGVLIVDDYGHWDGCRKAVDEYFAATSHRPLLVRVDYTGRVAIKP